MASIEHGLGGSPSSPTLQSGADFGEPASIVLVLFDGLGIAQMQHQTARVFRASLGTELECGFPSTTTVSLSTVATGLAPSQHGTVGHLSWYPELGQVVNTLKWIDLTGSPVASDYASVLPGPNLWERMRALGVEPITVQPGGFQGSPLSRVLYRGARFEPAWDWPDLVEATISLASTPRRLIFTYVPFVDVAGHSFGLTSSEFTEAMKVAASIWEGVLAGVPPDVAVVGTADHGLVEVEERDKIKVRGFDGLRFAGDARVLQVWGEGASGLTERIGGVKLDGAELLGADPSEKTLSHLPDAWVAAPDGAGFFPPAFDRRLHAYHGGLSPDEMKIPLLMG